MTDAATIAERIKAASNDIRIEWSRLTTLQKRIEGKLTRTWMPENVDAEYRDLFRKSASPWLLFIRDSIAQGLLLDGYTSTRVWRDAWQRNGMDGRQSAVNREVIGLGKSYGMSLPARDGDGVVMRALSARSTYAVFEDPWDEHPLWVLARLSKPKADAWSGEWLYVDETGSHRWTGDARRPLDVREIPHGLDYTPVVQLSNTLAIDGTPQSSVEPALPIYQRVVDATFTLQMVQRYGAFPQKWMAGGQLAKDEHGNALVRAAADSLLHADGENGETARFGTFQAADLNQVVGAVDAHIKHMSAVCQVPPHYLLGAVVNMSAEGIAAAESGYFRNIGDRKQAIGEGYELWFRDAAEILGDTAAADDSASQVHWADVSTRSLAQISDAVVKLAGTGAPLELLFAMVPGWSKTDVLEAAAAARGAAALDPDPTPPRLGLGAGS